MGKAHVPLFYRRIVKAGQFTLSGRIPKGASAPAVLVTAYRRDP